RLLLGSGRTDLRLVPDGAADTVRVLAVFDGRVARGGGVRFRALVEGTPGTQGEVSFLVFPSGGAEPLDRGSRTGEVRRRPGGLGRPAAAPADAPRLVVRSGDGRVCSPLTPEDRPPVPVAVRGEGGAGLVRAVRAAVGADGLAGRLREQGLPELSLE